MVKLKVNIGYGHEKVKGVEPDEKRMTNQELTFNYISYAVSQKYKEGLESQWRRLWGRIQRKFDEAIEKNGNEVELEHSELDFIKIAFNDAKFPAVASKYVVMLEDEIVAVKDAAK